MPKPAFFIFSLPRSGTSWLSLFLSGRDSYCYHEPTADYTPIEWAARAKLRPESIVGAIDTGAYRYPELVRNVLGDIRYIEIVREPLEIHESLRTAGLSIPDIYSEQSRLKGVGCTDFIQYDLLGDLDYLRALWAALIGTPFDLERAAQFVEMRVQRDPHMFIAHRPNLNQHMRNMLT